MWMILSFPCPKAQSGVPVVTYIVTWSIMNVTSDVNDSHFIFLDTLTGRGVSAYSRGLILYLDVVNCWWK